MPRPAFASPGDPAAIVAEGGAAEDRVEDTRSALDLAMVQGCDFIQVNLVPTKEGSLVARRDHELSTSTDIASRPQFADRKTTKTIDGAAVTGWFSEDFTLDELKTLLCVEAQPTLRPQNAKWSGKEGLMSLPEVLQLARDGCVKTGRTIGVAVRPVHAKYFADEGLDVVSRLANELTTEGYVAPASAIWMQSDDADTLRTFGQVSRVRRMMLVDAGGATDAPAPAVLTTGLGDVKSYADAIGLDQSLLFDFTGTVFPAPTTLALEAHNAGLKVFSRTARAENQFLPPPLRKGDKRWATYNADRGDVQRLLVALFADRLDGVVTDVPGEALRARQAVLDAVRQGPQRAGG